MPISSVILPSLVAVWILFSMSSYSFYSKEKLSGKKKLPNEFFSSVEIGAPLLYLDGCEVFGGISSMGV